MALWVGGVVAGQTTVNGSFVHDGVTRTYSFYVPAAYVPGQAVPLLLNLHGTGSNGATQAQTRDYLRALAAGAVLSVVQFFVQGYLATRLPFTSFVTLADGLLVAPALIAAGILLAAIASGFAIRRYLRI